MLRQAYHFKAILIWQNGPFNCMNTFFKITTVLSSVYWSLLKRKVYYNKVVQQKYSRNLPLFFKIDLTLHPPKRTFEIRAYYLIYNKLNVCPPMQLTWIWINIIIIWLSVHVNWCLFWCTMAPRDKCGSVGSGSHQLIDKEYAGELCNVVFAFSAGFLLALNKERQRHMFRKMVGQFWELM